MAKYIQSVNKPDIWFKIVGYDKDTQRAKLEGKNGIQFEEKVTAENLKRLGYQLVKSEGPPV